MTSLRIVLSVFGIIFVAELPDKTALATLVLATRNPPLPVFWGAASALTLQSVIAVAAGWLLALLPAHLVQIAAGLVFLIAAVAMWRGEEDGAGTGEGDHAERGGAFRTARTAFAVIFMAELGDLTQIGTAALAAHYRAPLRVFAGAALALWSVAGLAAFVGHRSRKYLNPRVTQRVAAVLFAVVGIALILGLW